MDWAELNPDILRLIAKKVGDISNFIRFRAVCKYWRSVVPPSNLPQQLPYVIQFKRKSASSFDIQFGSLFANITHTLSIQISQLKGQPLVCSLLTSGYVLLRFFQSKTWILLNPLTGYFKFPFLLQELMIFQSTLAQAVVLIQLKMRLMWYFNWKKS